MAVDCGAERADATPLEAIAERYGVPLGDLDGWSIAVNLTRSGCRLHNAPLRAYAERLAARAVLQRAARLVGPLRAATHVVREPLREPYAGELDVEATLENLLGKRFPEDGDLIVSRRAERRHQVVLMVDTSLSMSGENMAIAAVAAAVLALKLHPEDLSVVVFEDKACAVSRLHAADPPAEVVARMLDQPVRGYTNIAAAADSSSPTAWSRRGATRCRSRTASHGSSCCSPRTTRWTRSCAAGSPTPGTAASFPCARTPSCRTASWMWPTGFYGRLATLVRRERER